MPPTTNFYQQETLFQVFAQHLPSNGDKLSALDYLREYNGKHLGALSFADPDNPVVKAPQWLAREDLPLLNLPSLQVGERILLSTQIRKPFADTVAYHQSAWPTVQALQQIKQKADPQNRLQALRWALQAEHSEQLVWHPRPDVDFYRQQLLGFEHVHSALNLTTSQYANLARHDDKFFQIHQEVVRTYCKNTASEIQLLKHMLPLLQTGQASAHLVYAEGKLQPQVLGVQYMLT